MLPLLSIVLTCLALILIPGFFISWRLSLRFSLKNILRSIKISVSGYDGEAERNEKRDTSTVGERENRGKIPKHVAFMLDGNVRWGKKKGVGMMKGIEAGGRRFADNFMGFFTRDCFTMGINTITVFAWTTENWNRSTEEVVYTWQVFENCLREGMPHLQKYKVKISFIGNRKNISESFLNLIQEAEESTKNYKGKQLIVAIDYSGRFDILQACKSLAENAKEGLIQVNDIDEKTMDQELLTRCSEFPNPDLLIRTSGEQRISNFFLWQSAYTELYFSKVLWPDFGEVEWLEALTWYQKRQRRFGRRV